MYWWTHHLLCGSKKTQWSSPAKGNALSDTSLVWCYVSMTCLSTHMKARMNKEIEMLVCECVGGGASLSPKSGHNCHHGRRRKDQLWPPEVLAKGQRTHKTPSPPPSASTPWILPDWASNRKYVESRLQRPYLEYGWYVDFSTSLNMGSEYIHVIRINHSRSLDILGDTYREDSLWVNFANLFYLIYC